MKPLLRPLLFLSIFFLLYPFLGLTDPAKKWGPAARIVNEFCHEDGMGKRLSSDFDSVSKRLTLWDDEPGWDSISIIKNFKIIEETYERNMAHVMVTYEVTSKQNDEGVFVPTHEKENVTYKLQLHQGKWKIKEPQLMPHVLEIGLKIPK